MMTTETKPTAMSQKLWDYIQSCSEQELKELIQFGSLVSDPLSQELIKRLAE